MKKLITVLICSIFLIACDPYQSEIEGSKPMLTKVVNMTATMDETCSRGCFRTTSYAIDGNVVFNKSSKMHNCFGFNDRSVTVTNVPVKIFSDGSIRYELTDEQLLNTEFTLCFGEKPDGH